MQGDVGALSTLQGSGVPSPRPSTTVANLAVAKHSGRFRLASGRGVEGDPLWRNSLGDEVGGLEEVWIRVEGEA